MASKQWVMIKLQLHYLYSIVIECTSTTKELCQRLSVHIHSNRLESAT